MNVQIVPVGTFQPNKRRTTAKTAQPVGSKHSPKRRIASPVQRATTGKSSDHPVIVVGNVLQATL